MASLGAKQLAVRVEDEMIAAIDKKRMEIAEREGSIPTRSDIVRMAIEAFLAAGEGQKAIAKK